MNSLTVHAPAKVNLVLRVLGKRPNGYHDLFMVMEKLSLSDELTLESIPSGIELLVDGESDAGMQMEKNLAWRAAAAFREAAKEKRGVRIRLTKRIPVAAGLGGGSSDAGAVLKGLNRLWEKNWTPEGLADLGSPLGGDVPFFCYEGPAIAEGIGDKITPIPKLPNLFILLINPGFAVSTPWVYQEYDKLGLTVQGGGARYAPPFDVAQGMLFERFRDVTSNLHNDLEKVTIARYPEIGEIKSYLDNHGAIGSQMSGSGPTVFGIFEDEKTRNEALVKIQRKNWKAFAADNLS